MGRFFRMLWRFITAPFVGLFWLLALVGLKLIEWGIAAFLKIGNTIMPLIAGRNITLDKDDPKSQEIDKYSHNIDAIITDIWVADKKMDKLIGKPAITKDLKIETKMSTADAIYCYKQSEIYKEAVKIFQTEYFGKYAEFADFLMKDRIAVMKANLKGAPLTDENDKPVKRKRYCDDSILLVRRIRKYWKNALKTAKKEIGEIETIDNAEVMVKMTEENMMIVRVLLSKIFLEMYSTMIYLNLNFYGHKTPIYNI